MALSRSELKAVIKELLIEVLSEGLGNVQVNARRGAPVVEARRHATQPRARTAFDPRLDTPIGKARGQQSAASQSLQETIKRESGGNSVIADILADTAMTTLPTMVQNDRGLSGGGPQVVQQEQFNGTPEEAFGEDVTGRWANLAFASPKNPA